MKSKDMVDVIASFLENAKDIKGFNVKYFLSQIARLTTKVVKLQKQTEKQQKEIDRLEKQLKDKDTEIFALQERIEQHENKQKKFQYIVKQYDALTPTDKLIQLKKFNKQLNLEIEQIS